MVEFKEWPKIPRGQNEEITITEKIDGTNACIIVEIGTDGQPHVIGMQSRSNLLAYKENGEWIRCLDEAGKPRENYGFAAWVIDNEETLSILGEGYHYGEWAGPGIQKNPHNLERKTFFLFNSDRWRDGRQQRPEGVECVPVLYEGPEYVYDDGVDGLEKATTVMMSKLWYDAKDKGYHPEGVVVWYHKTRRYEKYTYENANGKWAK